MVEKMQNGPGTMRGLNNPELPPASSFDNAKVNQRILDSLGSPPSALGNEYQPSVPGVTSADLMRGDKRPGEPPTPGMDGAISRLQQLEANPPTSVIDQPTRHEAGGPPPSSL